MAHKRVEYALRRFDRKFDMMYLHVGNELGIWYCDYGLSELQLSWLEQYLQLRYLAVAGWGKLMERTICRWRGHSMECTGVAGVESGSEDLFCGRCGLFTRVYFT
jgi:hypothetical protein